MTNREKRHRLAAEKGAPAHRDDDAGCPEYLAERQDNSKASTHAPDLQPQKRAAPGLQQFIDAARSPGRSGIAIDLRIILAPEELARLIVAGFVDRDAQRLVMAISCWLKACRSAAPGRGPLCAVTCPHEFNDKSLPAAYIIAQPFSGGDVVTVTGICERCVERAGGPDGLERLALAHWRQMLPDATPLAEGRA